MHLFPSIPSANSLDYFPLKYTCGKPAVEDCSNNINTNQLSFEILRWYSSEQIGEWLDAVGTAHSVSALRRIKGKTVSSFKRNPIMESKLTHCVNAGIGGDLNHLSDTLDT
jgi:hypothetical protein